MKNKSYLFIVFLLFANLNYSQKVKFVLKDNKFEIFDRNISVYKDKQNFLDGACVYNQIIESQFENQFYLYIENECTIKKMKHLYKIYWHNNKFTILNYETIQIDKKNIICYSSYYNNFVIDTISFDKLNAVNIENLLYQNTNKKINSIPIYYQNKQIGEKNMKYEQLLFDYPIINDTILNNNVPLNNEIAYILYLNKVYDESIFLLTKIIQKFPTRVVTYLNIADCYWETKDKPKAIENYKKYISLMTEQKKDLKKIPKYVYERVK